MKGFGIYVKNNLLEAKHYECMGNALWLYLYLLDKMTSVNERGEGKVLGGKPIKYGEIRTELGVSKNTYTKYVDILERSGYIKAIRTPYGYSFTVFKAVKIFSNKEIPKKGESIEIPKKGEYKEDSTAIDKTILGETSSPRSLSNKEKHMWNQKGEKELVIDDEGDGSLIEEKKPQTKKYPNAPAVRKLFQEILGKNPPDWKKNTTVLRSCEELYTGRGLIKIQGALVFYKEHKEDKFCPVIDTPTDLNRKYEKLSRYKTNL